VKKYHPYLGRGDLRVMLFLGDRGWGEKISPLFGGGVKKYHPHLGMGLKNITLIWGWGEKISPLFGDGVKKYHPYLGVG